MSELVSSGNVNGPLFTSRDCRHPEQGPFGRDAVPGRQPDGDGRVAQADQLRQLFRRAHQVHIEKHRILKIYCTSQRIAFLADPSCDLSTKYHHHVQPWLGNSTPSTSPTRCHC